MTHKSKRRYRDHGSLGLHRTTEHRTTTNTHRKGALFDKNGRRIPPGGLDAEVVDADTRFFFVQPSVSYADAHERAARLLTGLPSPLSAEAEFERRSRTVLDRLNADPRTANICKGVALPLYLPSCAAINDYGGTLDRMFLGAAGAAYTAHNPMPCYPTQFHNYRADVERGAITVVPGSRHERLLEVLRAAPSVAVYFPAALQGFSRDAAIAQMTTLPKKFLLAGAIEASVAIVTYPEIFDRDLERPGIDCAAVQCRGLPLCFRASGYRLYFDDRFAPERGNGWFSSGLIVLG